MHRFRFGRGVIALAVAVALASAVGAQSNQSQVAADAPLFIKALSTRPGSVIAGIGILEFTPPGAESPDPAHRGDDGQHGVYAATVERELKAAGFEGTSTQGLSTRTCLVIARRPASK
jgi:hypothetical protein